MKKIDDVFSELLTETAKVAGVAPKSIRVSKGSKKRWYDLALYWEIHGHIFESVFYKALFHIARGTRSSKEPRLSTLAMLVEEAILDVPVALDEWRKLQSFRFAFFDVSITAKENHRCKSITIREFAYHRLYVRTFYRNEVQLQERDLACLDRRQIKQIRTAAKIRHEFFRFKEIIELILPTAAKWPEDYLTSQTRIFSEIKRCHGFDYTGREHIFDELVWLLQRKLDGKPCYGQLFRVSHIPDSVAALIWPQGMEKEICRQFLVLSRQKPSDPRHIRNYTPWDAPQKIVDTWAFGKLCSWREEHSYPLPDKVRAAMLSYSLGVHPATAKSA